MTVMMVALTRDHPRSRGVYDIPAIGATVLSGSSPLARGLLGTVLAVQPLTGIIPARAGFTPCLMGDRCGLGDHPRSRGVYDLSQHRLAHVTGSSPLARGLPPVRGGLYVMAGIIPARAGFTHEHHPRQHYT